MNHRNFITTAIVTAAAILGVSMASPAIGHGVVATYVHRSLAGGTTACGTTWSNGAMEVASRTHSCGTRLRLRNPHNGATVTVRVTDHSPNSALDLTRHAFSHLAPLSQGRVTVEVTRL